MPCTARWTLANVNSSAITARHPDVPNLICVAIGCLVCFEGNLKLISNSRFDSIRYDRFYMTDKRLVLTTCGSLEEARSIAHTLVERQLAACVNIAPQIESVYRWQGEVETATECLLVIKTKEGACDRLREALSELNSYNLPECIELSLEDGRAAYLGG